MKLIYSLGAITSIGSSVAATTLAQPQDNIKNYQNAPSNYHDVVTPVGEDDFKIQWDLTFNSDETN